MLTAFIVLLSVCVVVLVGESVRGQCRRMLSRPLIVLPAAEDVAAPVQAGV